MVLPLPVSPSTKLAGSRSAASTCARYLNTGSLSLTSASGPPPGTMGGGLELGAFWGRLARGACSVWAEEEEEEEEVMCFVVSRASCHVGFPLLSTEVPFLL